MTCAAPHKAAVFIALSLVLHFIGLSIVSVKTDVVITEQGSANIEIELSKKNSSLTTEKSKSLPQKKPASHHIATVSPRPLIKTTAIKPIIEKQLDEPRPIAAANNDRKITATTTTQENSRSSIDTTKITSILNTELSRYFHYPRAAQRRNWQGQVLLEFIILSDGDISQIKVNKSSGYSILDNAAMEALNKIEQRTQLALAINGHKLAQVLPVTYRLINH
ncbi:MAG: TonB family protein [Gammaproteobacteria bacterium]|nr:TonB family protein [Gammaproteobacteria bacterium]